jgi:hypothetical protein
MRSLFAAIPLALALGAAAQAAESPLDALFACREISDDTARLVCLDREVATLRGQSKREEIIAVDRKQLEKDSYGLHSSTVPLPTPESKKEVATGEPAGSAAEPRIVRDKHGQIEGLEHLAVARLSKTPYGKLVVKLQNGQVWTQSDTIEIFLPRGTPQEQMTVSISNAALGSHKMQLNGDGPWFRVYREK